jgi:hypothetical protein
MYDPRNNLSTEVAAQLIQHFGDKVFRTIIPRNVRLAEAPSFGKPALFHDKDSRGALAYLALAGELLRRHDEQQLNTESEVHDLASTSEAEAAPEPVVTQVLSVPQDPAATPESDLPEDSVRSGT